MVPIGPQMAPSFAIAGISTILQRDVFLSAMLPATARIARFVTNSPGVWAAHQRPACSYPWPGSRADPARAGSRLATNVATRRGAEHPRRNGAQFVHGILLDIPHARAVRPSRAAKGQSAMWSEAARQRSLHGGVLQRGMLGGGGKRAGGTQSCSTKPEGVGGWGSESWWQASSLQNS